MGYKHQLKEKEKKLLSAFVPTNQTYQHSLHSLNIILKSIHIKINSHQNKQPHKTFFYYEASTYSPHAHHLQPSPLKKHPGAKSKKTHSTKSQQPPKKPRQKSRRNSF